MTLPSTPPAGGQDDVLPLAVEDIRLQLISYLLAYAYQHLTKESNSHEVAILQIAKSADFLTAVVLQGEPDPIDENSSEN